MKRRNFLGILGKGAAVASVAGLAGKEIIEALSEKPIPTCSSGNYGLVKESWDVGQSSTTYIGVFDFVERYPGDTEKVLKAYANKRLEEFLSRHPMCDQTFRW